MPEPVDALYPETARQCGQQRGKAQLFTPGRIAAKIQQHQRHQHHTAVDVGQAVGHIVPEKVAEKQPVGQLQQVELRGQAEGKIKQSALALLHLQQHGQQKKEAQRRRQHAAGRKTAKPAAKLPLPLAGPQAQKVQNAEQAHRPGNIKVQQYAKEDKPRKAPVAAPAH